MNSYRFQSILFDMDGTLIDSEPLWFNAEASLMSEFGYNWTIEDQKNCLGGPLLRAGSYMQGKAGGVKTPHFFADQLLERVAIEFEQVVIFLPGVFDLLREVRDANLPTALVSASPRILMNSCLKGLSAQAPDLADLFSLSISLNDVERSKPDPEGYLKAAEKLGVDITQSLVVEDSATGVQAGIASGAWVLALPHIVEISPHERLRVRTNLDGATLEELAQLFVDAK